MAKTTSENLPVELVLKVDKLAEALGHKLKGMQTSGSGSGSSGSSAVGFKVKAHGMVPGKQLLFQQSDGTWASLFTTFSQETDKAYVSSNFTAVPGKVLWYDGTETVTDGAYFPDGSVFESNGVQDFRYTSNCGTTLTPGEPIYVIFIGSGTGATAGSSGHIHWKGAIAQDFKTFITQMGLSSGDRTIVFQVGVATSDHEFIKFAETAMFESSGDGLLEPFYATKQGIENLEDALETLPFIKNEGLRGSLAGYEKTGTVWESKVNKASSDKAVLTDATVTVSNFMDNEWDKSNCATKVYLCRGVSTITLGDKWHWANGQAPTLNSAVDAWLVLDWIGDTGLAQYIPVSA